MVDHSMSEVLRRQSGAMIAGWVVLTSAVVFSAVVAMNGVRRAIRGPEASGGVRGMRGRRTDE